MRKDKVVESVNPRDRAITDWRRNALSNNVYHILTIFSHLMWLSFLTRSAVLQLSSYGTIFFTMRNHGTLNMS